MKKSFTKIINAFGINQAIFYSIALRGWQLLAGPVALFLVAHYFSPTQQGFYYTFGSLLTLQMFFEMGLSFVIIQFVSHEFSILGWKKNGRISGGAHIKRFKALASSAFLWYLIISLFFLFIVLPFGLYFFSLKHTSAMDFSWRAPWCILVIATTFNLILTPLLAIIEGSGRVNEIYGLRLAQNIIGTILAWIIIISGGGLFNACAVAIANACISFSWLYKKNKLLLRLVTKTKTFSSLRKQQNFSWNDEVLPMQWRIAVSWIASYFIYQIAVPILFYYHNPIIAGQFGMTLAITSMITFCGQAWLNAKAPFMGRLVAEKNWLMLDQLFYKIMLQSSLFVLLACIGFIGFTLLLQQFPIIHRLLPAWQVAALAAGALINHLINCFGQYLRSHKREPFMWLSVISGILFGSASWYFGRKYGSDGIVLSLIIISLIYGLPSSWIVWKRSKDQWHK